MPPTKIWVQIPIDFDPETGYYIRVNNQGAFLMNISSINNAADIARYNEANVAPTPLPERIIQMLIDEGNVFDNMPVVLYAIESMIHFHHVNVEAIMNGELDAHPGTWAFDEGKLVAALQILKQVEMPEPDSHLEA